MSTALSKVRGNSAYKYYKFRMKRNSRAWIVALVLNLLGLPMMFIAQNIFYTNKLKTATDAGELFNQYETGVAVFAVIGIFCIAIAAIGGVFTVFASFDYLYNKSLVDMAYSAPLTGTARYTADFMAGLINISSAIFNWRSYRLYFWRTNESKDRRGIPINTQFKHYIADLFRCRCCHDNGICANNIR